MFQCPACEEKFILIKMPEEVESIESYADSVILNIKSKYFVCPSCKTLQYQGNQKANFCGLCGLKL